MNERKEYRLKSPYSIINLPNTEYLSPDEYCFFANNFNNLPKDQFQTLFAKLHKSYISNIPCNQEQEFLMLKNIISNFSLKMSDDVFSDHANILCLIIHKSFKNSREYRDLFKSYFSISIHFLMSDNPIFKLKTLSVISRLTSSSSNLCRSVFRIIPIQFFLNFIIQSIDFASNDQNCFHIMHHSAHIVRNIFCSISISKINVDTIDSLFECICSLCESQTMGIVPDMIFCVRSIIASNGAYCAKIDKLNLIPHFNAFLKYDDERIRSSVLLVFYQLVLNRIGTDSIDFISIYQMILAGESFSLPAIKVICAFLQTFPESADVYFHFDIISLLSTVFQEGSFDVKIEALNIFSLLLHNALPENKFALIQMPNLIDSLLEMTRDVQEIIVKLIFTLIHMIISIANAYNYHETIKKKLVESQNIEILDDLANQEGPVADIATQLLRNIICDK